MVAQPQPQQPPRMTVEEFMALPDDGNRHELVRGELRTMPPPHGMHGRIEIEIMAELRAYLMRRAEAAGWTPDQGLAARDRLVGFVAAGEVGLQFTLPDDPNQIRGADGVYVPAEQVAAVGWDGRGYFPAVPHLVIEVIGDATRADDLAEKVQDYLTGGARRVWCLYQRTRTIHIHDASAPLRVVRGGGALTDDELLPGFSVPLALIFPA